VFLLHGATTQRVFLEHPLQLLATGFRPAAIIMCCVYRREFSASGKTPHSTSRMCKPSHNSVLRFAPLYFAAV